MESASGTDGAAAVTRTEIEEAVLDAARDLAAVQPGTRKGVDPVQPEFWEAAARVIELAKKLPSRR